MIEEIFKDCIVKIDDEKELCYLYDLDGNLLDTISGYYLNEWLFSSKLFEYTLAHLRTFSDEPYRYALYSLEKGIIEIDQINRIDTFLWNDLMLVITYDGKFGLLDFDLNWVLKPIYDHIESPDMALSGFIYLKKDNNSYIFTSNRLMFPTNESCETDIVFYNIHNIILDIGIRLTLIIIKESNNEGKWRYVYIRQESALDYFIYESPFIYPDFESDGYCIEYTENGKKVFQAFPFLNY